MFLFKIALSRLISKLSLVSRTNLLFLFAKMITYSKDEILLQIKRWSGIALSLVFFNCFFLTIVRFLIVSLYSNIVLLPEVVLEGARGARALPIFCNHLFFCSHIKEPQTILLEVELIINNASLTYVYPNTIETCLTPNHLLFGRQLLFSPNATSIVVRNLAIL